MLDVGDGSLVRRASSILEMLFLVLSFLECTREERFHSVDATIESRAGHQSMSQSAREESPVIPNDQAKVEE